MYVKAFTALLILLIPAGAEEIRGCTEISERTYFPANDISENATMCINITASDITENPEK